MAVQDLTQRLRAAGLGLVAAAAASGVVAAAHMRAMTEAYGVICGSGPGPLAHCAACYVAVALGLAGGGLLVVATWSQRRAIRVQ